jgi:asparagine synthase (glutamine-hydrolysing)
MVWAIHGSIPKVAEKEVTDEMMANARFRFPLNTPQNKEEYRYRTIFEEHFPSETLLQQFLQFHL